MNLPILKSLLFTSIILISVSVSQAQFSSLYSVPSGTFLEDVVYADSNTVMVTGSSLYRTSIDGGRNWIGLSSGGMSVKAAHFPSKQIGIVVGNQGLYRINDECGYFWGWGNNKYIGVTKDLLDVYFTDNQHGIVCGNDGTLRYTANQGTNWTAIVTGTTNHIKGVWSTNDSVSYACTNAGIVLKIINQIVVSSTVINASIDFNKIAFTDQQTGFIVGSLGTVYKTTDAGTTWNLLSVPTTENLLSLAFTSTNHGVITGSNGKRFVTNDGGQTWTQGITVQTGEIRSVAFKNQLEGYCVSSNFVEYTKDGGYTWMRVDGTMQSVHFPTPERGYASGYYGVAFKTDDGGNNWKPMNLNTLQYLNDIYFINRDTGLAVGGTSIFRTLDGGETWNPITNPATSSLYAVHFTDYNHGVAAGYRQNILYTANGGQTWTISQNSNSTLYYLDIKFPSNQIGYMCSSVGSILKTTNGGASWTATPSGTSSQLANLSFVNDNVGWAVGNTGVILHTNNGGVSWQAQTSGVTTYLNGVHFLDENRGVVVGSSGTYLITTNGGATWQNRTNGSTNNDYTDVFFTNDLHGYAVSGISISGIGAFSNFNPTVPYCPGDAIGFNSFDPYYMPNATSQVVLEMTGVNDDFSSASIIGTGIVDSVGLITSTIPITTAEGIYKTRIRDVNDASKTSFEKFITVSSAPSVSVSIQGNNLLASSNQSVNFQWYASTSGIFMFYANGASVPISAAGQYYVVAISGCCTTYSETYSISLCNGQATFSNVSQNVSICSGDQVLVGNSIYTEAGSYSDSLSNVAGCDSVVITQLTVLDRPTVNLGNDTLVCDGLSVIVDAGSGLTDYFYLWNSGQNTQSIVVNSDGLYSVQVSNSNGCSASDSVNVAFDFCLSAEELAQENLSIYPNPSEGKFTIESNWDDAHCRIFSLLGTCVFDAILASGKQEIALQSSGIYLVQIDHDGTSTSRKIIINTNNVIH